MANFVEIVLVAMGSPLVFLLDKSYTDSKGAGYMFGFIFYFFTLGMGFLAAILFFIINNHAKQSAQRHKERLISDFVDANLPDNIIYPVAGIGGSAFRASRELNIDQYECVKMIYSELSRRGLPASRPI